MVYETKCAWCGQSMDTKECEHTEFTLKLKKMGLPVISHGICSKCSEKALEDAESTVKKKKEQ